MYFMVVLSMLHDPTPGLRFDQWSEPGPRSRHAEQTWQQFSRRDHNYWGLARQPAVRELLAAPPARTPGSCPAAAHNKLLN
jgi:hypothetical protein